MFNNMLIVKLLKSYGFIGSLRLAVNLIFTNIFYRPARLIRLPFYIRGRHAVSWGAGFTTGVGVRIDAFAQNESSRQIVTFGKRVQINDYVHVAAIESVTIGDDVLIASRVFISDHNHGCYDGTAIDSSPLTPPSTRPLKSEPVQICDRVWIGENVSILPGVTIGAGSIVGAGSVVTQNVPENCIAVGVPARVIKYFDPSQNQWLNKRA